MAAAGELKAALEGAPDQALARIIEIEHQADQAVREIHRLVDHTFITPYDKRDIVLLTHRLDDIPDSMRTVVRFLVSYRALEAKNGAVLAKAAAAMCDLILQSAARLKHVVDQMPHFDHDDLRRAVNEIDNLEDQSDELFARAVRTVMPEPDQPLTAAMLAWRDIFQLLERTTDYCGHAIGVIISIARQEGS